MPYNGSGVFNRIYNWVNDAAASVLIRADRMDNEMNGFATGLSNCITKDGQTTITANIPLAGFKFTGGAAASASTEYATYGQILTSKALPTVGGTANAITVAHTIPYTSLYSGMEVSFVASGANTTAVTLAVDGLSAAAVNRSGATALVAGDIPSGEQITVRYDGTRFELVAVAGKAPFLHTANTFAGTQTIDTIQTSGASGVVLKNSGGTTVLTVGSAASTASTFTGNTTVQGLLAVNGITYATGSIEVGGTASSPAFIKLAEDTDNGTNKVTIIAPASIASDYTVTLPSAAGTIALTSQLMQKFTSSDQTITNAGTLSIAHGLGAKPFIFNGVLKCTTAELGYSVDDEVSVAEWIRTEAATANYGFILTADATNIHVRFGTNGMLIKNKGSDTPVLITNASWRLVVKAIL